MPARVEGRRPNQSSAGRREAVTLLGQQPVADEHAGVVPIADAATVLCAASRDATRLVLSHTLPHGYLGIVRVFGVRVFAGFLSGPGRSRTSARRFEVALSVSSRLG